MGKSIHKWKIIERSEMNTFIKDEYLSVYVARIHSKMSFHNVETGSYLVLHSMFVHLHFKTRTYFLFKKTAAHRYI